MPPETPEEIAADQALDAKLGAFFQADTPAEPGPAEPEPQPEPEPEPGSDAAQPRDEKGRFAPKTEPEPQELFAGKYRSPKELEAAYKELETRLGTQGQELGDLRRTLEETLDQRLTQLQETAQQNQFAATAPALVQNLVDEGRYQEAAGYALQSGNNILYSQVMSHWATEEPFNAYAYDNHLRQQALLQTVEQKLAALGEPLQQQTTQREMEQAMAEFATDKPDMAAVAPEMLKVAEESPRILQLLQDRDPKVRVEVLDYLYTKARGRVSDTLTAAKQQADEQAQAEAREAKTQATVGASATAAQPKTERDKWRDEFRKVLFDDATSIRSGLTAE